MTLPDTTKFYINGEFTSSIDGHDIDVMNPSYDTVCAQATLGGNERWRGCYRISKGSL